MHYLARWKLRGVRPYVPGKPIEELARELGIKGEIIKLASNENPLGPSPMAVKAVENIIKDAHLYPDDSSYVLIDKLSRLNNVSMDEIILGNGSVEIMLMIALGFVNPGETIIASEKSFIMYRIVSDIIGANFKEVPMAGGKIDLQGILNAITDDTKVVFIANPNNPTGTFNPKEEVEDFMNKVRDDVIVVWDEAYYEYARGEDFKETLGYVKEGRNVVILRTFSKIYGLAGLRVGYGFAKKEIIDVLRRVRLPFNVNSFAQVAAINALDDKEHVEKSVKINMEGLQFLYQELSDLGLKYYKSRGNFILVDFGMDSDKPYKYLLERGIITRPVKNYNLPTCLRISVGLPEQNKKLVEAIREFVKNGNC
ncbi:MAG: histidinol-phosphate transaminase [candidate division WOR-3 bacterium]